jgi:hypothetical protein
VSAVWLLIAAALVAVTAFRVAGALFPGSITGTLAGAYLIGTVELLLVALGLSLFRAFTVGPVLICLGAIAAASLIFTRGRVVVRVPAWRAVFADPVLVVLAAAVVLGLGYTVALSLGVPQVEDDALTFHLLRAALWRQHHGITYLAGTIDFRNNGYPPVGELGFFTALTMGGSDRYVGLAQMVACVSMVVAATGIGRRIGLDRRQALFGGLVVATLPIVTLQSGAAMSDVTVASFLLAATLFLVDDMPPAPWLAGAATALAIATKLSAPLGVPVLLAVALLARPSGRRRARVVAVAAGCVAGAFWYVVNLFETGTWDGHVAEGLHVDRSLPAIAARLVRLGIEFIDVSGAVGRDRWLYAVAAAVVLLVAVVGATWRRNRDRLALGAVAAAIAVVPVVLPGVAHLLVRADFKFWLLLHRRDLADIDPGRDITIAASNYSWFGPLGSLALVGAAVLVVRAVRRRDLDRIALLFVGVPVYWLIAFAIAFFYQVWAGRFFIFPIALAASTWGLLLRYRSIAWGVTAIAATTLLLVVLNDAKRPSGVPLLERDKPESIWSTPRWIAQGGGRAQLIEAIHFLDEHVPAAANVGLAFTPAEPGYPFFGPGLDRQVEYVTETARDTHDSSWVFRRVGRKISLCPSRWHTVAHLPVGWTVLRRDGNEPC